MATALISGCNRGIGPALCRQLAERGDEVIGVCRHPSAAVKDLGIRLISGIDVSDALSIETLKNAVGGQHIDILISNAGMLQRDSLDKLDYEAMTQHFQINTLGPLRVT